MKFSIIFFIILLISVSNQLEIEDEISKLEKQRLPILQSLSVIETPLSESVVQIYQFMSDLMSLEINEDKTKDIDLLVQTLTFRQTAIFRTSEEVCLDLQEITLNIQERLDEHFQGKQQISQSDFDVIYADCLVDILSDIQTLLYQDLICQFHVQVASESFQVHFNFYMNVLVETGNQLSIALNKLEHQFGLNLSKSKTDLVDILVSFQEGFFESFIEPFKELTHLLKTPAQVLKNEILYILLMATKQSQLDGISQRLILLIEAVSKILLVSGEDSALIQIYVVAASLKSSQTTESIQLLTAQIMSAVIQTLYRMNRQTKAKELLKNACKKFSEERIQSNESRLILNIYLKEHNFPIRLSGKTIMDLQNRLIVMDVLSYLDIENLSDTNTKLVIDNLIDLLLIPQSIYKPFNSAKTMFSNSVLAIDTHQKYYLEFYISLVEMAASGTINSKEEIQITFNRFLNSKMQRKQISDDFYVIMKIHNVLHIRTGQEIAIEFESYNIQHSLFENQNNLFFRNIFVHIYQVLNGPLDQPDMSDLELSQLFSGKTLALSLFDFLKVRIDYSDEFHDIATQRNSNLKFNVKTKSLHNKHSKSLKNEANKTSLRFKQIDTFLKIPGNELDKIKGHFVELLAGNMKSEDLEALRHMQFVDFSKEEGLKMRADELIHQYIIVQRISHDSNCRTRIGIFDSIY